MMNNALSKWLNRVHVGDCIGYLRQLPDESVDVVFADPPFNVAKHYASYYDKRDKADYINWSHAWLKECVRVLKPTGSLFVHNIPMWLVDYSYYLDALLFRRHWVVWGVSTQPKGHTLLPQHYGILYYTKSDKQGSYKYYHCRKPHSRCKRCHQYHTDYGSKPRHPFGPLLTDVWSDIERVRNHHIRNKSHPCQLPVPLIERLLLMSSDTGDIVLDPFFGNGITGIAAKRLQRHYIGFEIDQHYTTLAKTNIANTQLPTHLLSPLVSVDQHNTIITARTSLFPKLKPTNKGVQIFGQLAMSETLSVTPVTYYTEFNREPTMDDT